MLLFLWEASSVKTPPTVPTQTFPHIFWTSTCLWSSCARNKFTNSFLPLSAARPPSSEIFSPIEPLCHRKFSKSLQSRIVLGPRLLSDARCGLLIKNVRLFLCIFWIEKRLATAWRQPSHIISQSFPRLWILLHVSMLLSNAFGSYEMLRD